MEKIKLKTTIFFANQWRKTQGNKQKRKLQQY